MTNHSPLRTRLFIVEWMTGLTAIATLGMLVKSAAVFGVLAATPLTLASGRLSNDIYPRQAVQITNTGRIKADVMVECGFFKDGELLGSGMGYVYHLMPGSTGYANVPLPSLKTVADHTECRVDQYREARSGDEQPEPDADAVKQETPQ